MSAWTCYTIIRGCKLLKADNPGWYTQVIQSFDYSLHMLQITGKDFDLMQMKYFFLISIEFRTGIFL